MNINKAKEIFPNIEIENVVDNKIVHAPFDTDFRRENNRTTVGTLHTKYAPMLADIKIAAHALDCDYFYISEPPRHRLEDGFTTYFKKAKSPSLIKKEWIEFQKKRIRDIKEEIENFKKTWKPCDIWESIKPNV